MLGALALARMVDDEALWDPVLAINRRWITGG